MPVPRSVLPALGPVAGPVSAWPHGRLGRGGLGRGLPGGAALGDELFEPGPADAAERAVITRPVQDGHFQAGRGHVAALAVAAGRQGGQGHAERLVQGQPRGVVLLQGGGDLIGLAAEGHEAGLVGDRPVEGDPVDLVGLGLRADLGHHDLDLERLHALGEDRAEVLRVVVGDAARGHVAPVELVPGDVRVGDPGLAQVLVLVVPAHGGEGDPVVDLADLVQRAGGVGRHQHDPALVLQRDAAAAAGDPLAGVLGLVPHGLCG